MKLCLFAILAVGAVGCAKSAGGPLSHTFDNSKIAAVPLESKQTVTEAQQQYDVAQLRAATTESEYRDAEVEQDLAEYQADHAFVASQVVARDFAKGAPPSAETAASARKTAEAKVAFMRARRDWLAKAADATAYAVYAAQARLELERARIASSNNLTPSGFDVQVFQRQFEDRDTAAKRAGEAADSERKVAEAKLAAWAELERSALQVGNLKGPIESDHFATEFKRAPAEPMPAPPAEAAAPPPPAP